MKLVEVKFKNGVRGKIKDSMNTYIFICPLKNVEVGEYVLVETRQGKKYNNNENFRVAKIENIIDTDPNLIRAKQPYRYVVCKLAVNDFEERCRMVIRFRRKLRKIYEKDKAEPEQH